MHGEPVFKGTRLPVENVITSVHAFEELRLAILILNAPNWPVVRPRVVKIAQALKHASRERSRELNVLDHQTF